ncbi:MAG: EthD domain-containing protein, partial [Comamonas sp.]
MFKCIALLKRRSDLSKEQFVDYYENHHSVLIRSLFPEILEYRRNYIDLQGLFQFDGSAPIDFNSVTEMWFKDRASYDL